MKSFFIVCFLSLLITSNCFAQTNKVLTGDTSFWYGYQQKRMNQLKLKSLLNATDAFNFRFWTDRTVVDITSSDGTIFYAFATCFTDGYNEKKTTGKKRKVYSQQFLIDTGIARSAFKLVENVEKIPSDKLIKGWKQGLDGITYIFETATPKAYSFRTYWTPTAQDSTLQEAKLIKRFTKDIDSLLSLSKKYDTFFSALKPGSYVNGITIITKHTKRQSRAFKKLRPHMLYLQTKQDSLSKYLNSKLTKIFSDNGGIICYNEFDLWFSKENRLIKATTPDKDLDREDKKQFKLCRKKIMAAFKHIPIDFIHSEVSYNQRLSFDGTKANVYQKMYWR